jgi:hypothetical protein
MKENVKSLTRYLEEKQGISHSEEGNIMEERQLAKVH